MKIDKDYVYEVEIELTTKCNLSCPLCARNYSDSLHLLDNNTRSLDDIIKQLDEYKNIKNLCLAGILSEPTIYSDLFGLIEYLNSRNIEIELYTNADLHDDEYWYELGKLVSEKTKVYFTICGSTQEIHERYRVGSNLNNILRHAEWFRKGSKYDNDYLQHIMFEYNRVDFDNMGEIRGLFSNECNIDSLPYRERFDVLGEVDPEINQRKELLNKYNNLQKISRHFRDNKIVECKSYDEHFISIDNNGDISPCFLYRMYVKEKWDMDYTDIMDYKYDFCYECEKMAHSLIKKFTGLERMG